MKNSLMHLTLLLAFVATPLSADDNWNQWGGQNRDFSVASSELDNVGGLAEAWRRELGGGYSAILAEDEKLYTMYRDGDDEIVICMNASNGETIWEKRYS
ncbi:MAG: hypothetical protein ACR2NP_11085, partial [Pirellulaceae bacterium]